MEGRLPRFAAGGAGSADVVEGDGAGSEEDEGKGDGGQCQGKFVAAVADQPVVEIDLSDSNREIDAEGESGDASEQA